MNNKEQTFTYDQVRELMASCWRMGNAYNYRAPGWEKMCVDDINYILDQTLTYLDPNGNNPCEQ